MHTQRRRRAPRSVICSTAVGGCGRAEAPRCAWFSLWRSLPGAGGACRCSAATAAATAAAPVCLLRLGDQQTARPCGACPTRPSPSSPPWPFCSLGGARRRQTRAPFAARPHPRAFHLPSPHYPAALSSCQSPQTRKAIMNSVWTFASYRRCKLPQWRRHPRRNHQTQSPPRTSSGVSKCSPSSALPRRASSTRSTMTSGSCSPPLHHQHQHQQHQHQHHQ